MRTRFVPGALLPLVAALALAGAAPAAQGDAASPAAATSPTATAPLETIHWDSSVGAVDFPHRMHAEDLGAECASCHHETVAAALVVPHPSYFDDFWLDCGTCHTGGTPHAASRTTSPAKRCASCHPERTSGRTVEMLTAKVAIHRSCWGCHEQSRGAEASAQCATCHQRERKPDAVAEGAEQDEADPGARTTRARTP